jgi:hypothetical protein
LIYGTDLPGASKQSIDTLQGKVRQLIGFSISELEAEAFWNCSSITNGGGTDFNLIVQWLVRAPMVRTGAMTQRKPRTSKVIAIGSAGSYTGCTLIALNLAMEISLL